eukprot:9180004-Pyramimonas_sp.AAC.1
MSASRCPQPIRSQKTATCEDNLASQRLTSIWRLHFVTLEATLCHAGGYTLSLWRLYRVTLEATL